MFLSLLWLDISKNGLSIVQCYPSLIYFVQLFGLRNTISMLKPYDQMILSTFIRNPDLLETALNYVFQEENLFIKKCLITPWPNFKPPNKKHQNFIPNQQLGSPNNNKFLSIKIIRGNNILKYKKIFYKPRTSNKTRSGSTQNSSN